jgi:hypothetical protein
MIAQVMTGLGLVVAGTVVGVHASHRRPVPADIAAQLKAALQSSNDAVMKQVADALVTGAGGKWRNQGEIVRKATLAATADSKLPADIRALYNAALSSADPATMKQIATSLKTKHPHLAGNLNDVAKILGG